MIHGNGDIASALKQTWWALSPHVNVVCVAENDLSKAASELDCIQYLNKDNHIVFFSTLGVYDETDPTDFAKHKVGAEHLVKNLFKHYTILRIGTITWGNNSYVTQLRKKIVAKEKPIVVNNPDQVRQKVHYMVTQDELYHWMQNIRLRQKDTITITGRRLTSWQLIQEIEQGKI